MILYSKSGFIWSDEMFQMIDENWIIYVLPLNNLPPSRSFNFDSSEMASSGLYNKYWYECEIRTFNFIVDAVIDVGDNNDFVIKNTVTNSFHLKIQPCSQSKLNHVIKKVFSFDNLRKLKYLKIQQMRLFVFISHSKKCYRFKQLNDLLSNFW